MADEIEYGARRHPRTSSEEEGDRFTMEERRELREFLRFIRDRKDDRPNFETMRRLVENWKEIEAIVEGKRTMAGVYRWIGEFAKWSAAVIGAILAYKTMMGGGK